MSYDEDRHADTTTAVAEEGPVHRATAAAGEMLAGAGCEPRAAWINEFLVARRDGDAIAPLVALARSGAQDAVPLKVALTVCWLSRSLPPDSDSTLRLPLDPLCEVIGLAPGPQSRRRIDRALSRLAELGLATPQRTDRRGWRSLTVVAGLTGPQRLMHGRRHLVLPQGFWLNGWCAVLPASAIVVFLALTYMDMVLDRGGSEERRVFISASVRERRFGFSEDFYYSGRSMLAATDLVRIFWTPIATSESEAPRMTRGSVQLRPWVLAMSPAEVWVRSGPPRSARQPSEVAQSGS